MRSNDVMTRGSDRLRDLEDDERHQQPILLHCRINNYRSVYYMLLLNRSAIDSVNVLLKYRKRTYLK